MKVNALGSRVLGKGNDGCVLSEEERVRLRRRFRGFNDQTAGAITRSVQDGLIRIGGRLLGHADKGAGEEEQKDGGGAGTRVHGRGVYQEDTGEEIFLAESCKKMVIYLLEAAVIFLVAGGWLGGSW